MALSRQKYKRVPDLYITGRTHVLKDGTVMWLQVMNPLERDEAQHDAQVARARLVMALKSEHGSDERTKVEASFQEDGRALAIDRLVNAKLTDHIVEAVQAVKSDPDWKERLDIMDRHEEIVARPAEDAERKLLEQINGEYLAEVQRRQDDEESFLRRKYQDFSDEELFAEYVELYINHRGAAVANAEYQLTEIWYAARVCEGVEAGPGEWDHAACENHVLQAYETKLEVRSLPEDLQNELAEVMSGLNMTAWEAKNSARQGSSSGSSPLPSEPAESTPSTQDATPDRPRGTSASLSGTR